MIDQGTIDKIFDRAQIVEVVGEFVSLKKRGSNYTGLCPFHNEKTPSFSVSPSKNIYKCFGCGKAGNPITFVMEHDQLSYVDALKYLAKKYHIDIVEETPSPEDLQKRTERESLFVATEYSRNYFVETLKNHKDGKAIAKAYLNERGLRDDIVEKFQIGYCLDERDTFTKTAINAGFNPDFLNKIGVTKIRDDGSFYDTYKGRIMFPIHAVAGKVVGFGGRSIKTDLTNTPKYINSPESEIYLKKNTLYGIYFAKNAISKLDKCYLVEGYLDVISMFQAGIENVVASSGTSLTIEQIRLIRRFTPNVTIVYDGDPAGIKAAFRGIPMILEEGMNVRVLLLPDGHDPDSFAKQYSGTALQEYLAKNEHDFITFSTEFLLKDVQNDPVKRATVFSDIVKTIAVIPDSIYRSVYIKECSALLDVDEKLLYEQINKIRKEKRNKTFEQQKEKQEQFESPLPQPEQTIEPQSVDRGIITNELDILRFLVLYGRNQLLPITVVNETTQITVREYILREIVDGSMEFLTPECKTIFDDFLAHNGEDKSIDEHYYINHQEELFRNFGIETLNSHYKLSKIHFQDKTKYDEDIDYLKETEAETATLEKLVFECVLTYKKKRIEMELSKIQDKIKIAAPEELEELLQKMMALDAFKKQIGKDLKRL